MTINELASRLKVTPQFIENRLKFSPYVKEAVVVGKDRPYLTAMLCIDMGIVGKWAEKKRISYTTYTDALAAGSLVERGRRLRHGRRCALPVQLLRQGRRRPVRARRGHLQHVPG